MIPISRPLIDDRTEKLVLEVLRSGRLARGPMVEDLEERFKALTGTRHAIAVTSGTTALEMALRFTVQPGDVVLTSPFTFAATLNAIIAAGATARFADVGSDFLIDPAEVEAGLDRSVAAIVPVHLYGQPANMSALGQIADRHGLRIIEDAAQAVGATHDDRPVGSSDIGCFSLYATKNVTTGEGGMITTNDSELAERLAIYANQGMTAPFEYAFPGTNHRMTDLQAAVALPQLDDLSWIVETRRANARRLSQGLAGVPWLILPSNGPDARPGAPHVYHQYTVRLGTDAPLSRADFRRQLEARGVASGVYYPRVVFDYPCFLEHPLVEVAEVPNARRMAQEVVSLPVFPGLTDGQLDHIVDSVREALDA